MTAFLAENLPQKRTGFLTVVRAIEILIFSAAIIYYSIIMFKGAQIVSFTSSSCDFMLSILQKPVSIFKSLLSSPLLIGIFLNFIVILIFVSSFFHHQQMENNDDEDGDADNNDVHGDFDDLNSTLSPSLAPPQMKYDDQEKAKTTAATMKTTATEGDYSARSKITSSASAQQQQEETVEVTNGVQTAYEVHQEAVFSDFLKLTRSKDIKKERTTVDGVKIRTTEQLTRDTDVTKVAKHYYFQDPAFADFPKLAEAHSLDSAKLQDTTANDGQISRNDNQNQTEKQPENEDHWGEEDDTMDATWRAINGEAKPQEKQLKKSETWPQRHKFVLPDEAYSEEIHTNTEEEELPAPSPSVGSNPAKELKKSMTFNDTVTIRRRGGMIRKDPSMNLEEFNKKVEAFIHNFNHEMRLQRQESDQRYIDMIKRGL